MSQGYVCPKCGTTEYTTGEMRATGGLLSKIFDIQTNKFTMVVCKHCKYTEFYAADTKSLENILDFFTQ